MGTPEHLYCAVHIWSFLDLSWFTSPGIAVLTTYVCCAQSSEVEGGWRCAASMECAFSAWSLGSVSSWVQLCTGACWHAIWFSLLGPFLDVPPVVSSAAEGALDKHGALHSNFSNPFCPQLPPLWVSRRFWPSFHRAAAHVQAESKSHLQVNGRALSAPLCTWLTWWHKRHLKGPEMFGGNANQSEYVSDIWFLRNK